MTFHKPVLGIDIGGTHVRIGIVADDLSLQAFEMVSSAILSDDPGGMIDALTNFVRSYCAAHMHGMWPEAVSIGFPSTLNKDKTRLLSAPNLAGLDGLEVVAPLEKALNVRVFMNRDVNLLMLNDMHSHSLRESGIVIGCYIGTGLGNAISIHGELLSGANGVAGELGHTPIYGNHCPCSCGGIGCMETIASGKHLVELQQRYFPDTPIGELFEKHADCPVLLDYVDGLSIPIATEITILDPDYIILGGGVLQMRAFPIELLKNSIAKYVRKPLPCEKMRFLISVQNQESGVIGAAIYAMEQLRKEQNHDCNCL